MADKVRLMHHYSKDESANTFSTTVLTAVFDAIDQNVFNCNLDGIKLEWCDKLESRAAVTYQESTYTKKQVYIRCSKQWLEKCSRKQLIEVILYEMLDLFLDVNTSGGPAEKKIDALHIHFLERAFAYLNSRFGINLKVNNNYEVDSDDSDVKATLLSLANDRKTSEKRALIDGFKAKPRMKVLTRKLFGDSKHFKCKKSCGITCYCGPPQMFRHRFFGANIFAISTVGDTVKCILCEKELKPNAMDAHLDNDCYVFKPLIDLRNVTYEI